MKGRGGGAGVISAGDRSSAWEPTEEAGCRINNHPAAASVYGVPSVNTENWWVNIKILHVWLGLLGLWSEGVFVPRTVLYYSTP